VAVPAVVREAGCSRAEARARMTKTTVKFELHRLCAESDPLAVKEVLPAILLSHSAPEPV
jgi:hypothetical protein